MIRVKPKDGLNVRHPQTGHLISGEIKIERSPAVRRLLKDGDLVETKAVSKKAAPKKKPVSQGDK